MTFMRDVLIFQAKIIVYKYKKIGFLWSFLWAVNVFKYVNVYLCKIPNVIYQAEVMTIITLATRCDKT